jgi:hypothetical protein
LLASKTVAVIVDESELSDFTDTWDRAKERLSAVDAPELVSSSGNPQAVKNTKIQMIRRYIKRFLGYLFFISMNPLSSKLRNFSISPGDLLQCQVAGFPPHASAGAGSPRE